MAGHTDEYVEYFKNHLGITVAASGLVGMIQDRLEAQHPEWKFSYQGDHCFYQGELFLHFAEETERRMWWVLVDVGDGLVEGERELAMSWNMNGMSDLV